MTKVTDAAGNVTTYGYDKRGRKIAANDPDMGASTYSYDVLDELKTSTNAASEVATLSYDLLGRQTQRAEPGTTSTWVWDSAGPKGIGKLASASTSGGYTRTHSYDSLGLPDQVQIKTGGNAYTIAAAYDAASRISKVTYPSGFAVAYAYNATGYQHQVSNAATSQVYWTAEARDAELHLTKQTAGNGVVTSQVFDPNTGQLTAVTAGTGGAVQSQSYTYDLLDKLLTRSDANTSLSESFAYDPLNRLTKSTVALNPTPLVATFSFNAIGNLISKSDVGTYSYPAPGQPRPHGVTSISGGVINTTFAYDTKGNMTSGNGLSVTYTAFNKPATIKRGTNTIAFDHDPEHQRFSQSSPSGVTLYFQAFGVLAERFGPLGGPQRWTNYLMVGGRYIGFHVENADETTLTRYCHTDHLGSIAVITNEVGTVAQRLSYDAWGQRRHPNGSPDPAGAITSETTRGFTGHEHLAEVGLIHMNGRVYDPLLARFGTPDPMTESPFSTQGWNRYSYVGNSPVNFTDPSGYCFLGCFWQKPFKALGNQLRSTPFLGNILTVAAGALCGPGCAALTSAVVTGLASGDLGLALRAGITSLITAAAFHAVGNITDVVNGTAVGSHAPFGFGSSAHLTNIAGHALVGCGSSVASGGKCGSGALAGAAGSFFAPAVGKLFPNPKTNPGHLIGGTVASAVAGGVASIAGGDKFANGATTAAFGYLFNQAARNNEGRSVTNAGTTLTAPADGSITSYIVPAAPGDANLYDLPSGVNQKVDVTGSKAFEDPGGTEVTRDVLDGNLNWVPKTTVYPNGVIHFNNIPRGPIRQFLTEPKPTS